MVAGYYLSEPRTDFGNRLMHAEAQLCLYARGFATTRFFAVFRQTMNVLLLRSFPQKGVKPRNVKVSGFPSPRLPGSRAANRPNANSACQRSGPQNSQSIVGF